MILRNVNFAEQRRVLSNPSQSVPAAAVTPVQIEPEISIAEPVAVASIQPLTAERVLEWLATQGDETRSRLTHVLATDLEELRAEAVQDGQITGQAMAMQKVQAQYEQVFAALKTLTSESEALFARQCETLSQACVAVVDQALSKLIGDAINVPGSSLAAVRQAIARVIGARDITIRVNASEFEVLNAKRGEIAACLGNHSFALVADVRVTSGGCIVDSSFGEIDARWESQLAALIATLHGRDAMVEEPL